MPPTAMPNVGDVFLSDGVHWIVRQRRGFMVLAEHLVTGQEETFDIDVLRTWGIQVFEQPPQELIDSLRDELRASPAYRTPSSNESAITQSQTSTASPTRQRQGIRIRRR